MKKVDARRRSDLDDLIRRYCEQGPASLPPTKFNANECWFPSERAQNKVRLQAFKPWALRAYGFARQFNNRSTFFITRIDPSKKQDRADQDILHAAGVEAVTVSEFLG
jgi:hypothetical protein